LARVLFICKERGGYGYLGQSSGLLNSAQFVVDMLNQSGIPAKLVQVVDNNDIDRKVFQYQPTHVFIEALWVVPEKFAVLTKLHPTVKWIVRVHSDVPFLAEEGIAVEWLFGYLQFPKVSIALNKETTFKNFAALAPQHSRVLYLPNYYPPPPDIGPTKPNKNVFRVGAFGAIRPMKNQLLQAMAAIRFADSKNLTLEFNINSTRPEGYAGSSVLRNLEALFADTNHKLVEHEWMSHKDFLHVMSQMDVALCVSMSETFCIVAADAITTGVPLICSDQIPWASSVSIVPTTDADKIIKKMNNLIGPFMRPIMYRWDRIGLNNYVANSKKLWLKYLRA
jgi:hypothetical protein